MCIKIVRNKSVVEFNPSLPLEDQVRGSSQVLVNYSPVDSKIDLFMKQFERIIKQGINCQMKINFSSNHTLEGYRVERKIEHLSKELALNDIIKAITNIHSETDKSLSELSDICERKAQ